ERGDHSEVTPATFWGTYGAKHQKPAVAALLRCEAHRLMAHWGQAKSRRIMRSGVDELMAWCTEQGYPVVVVTNTVSGAAVRAQLQKRSEERRVGRDERTKWWR